MISRANPDDLADGRGACDSDPRCGMAELEKSLADAQAQRDHYKEILRLLISARLTVEQLQRFADDDDETGCLPLQEFVKELEAIVEQRKGA